MIMILDFEMPLVSGLETIKEVSSLYNHSNFKIKSKQAIEGLDSDCSLLMPKFAMFSVHFRKGFEAFVREKGVDVILSKPPN